MNTEAEAAAGADASPRRLFLLLIRVAEHVEASLPADTAPGPTS